MMMSAPNGAGDSHSMNIPPIEMSFARPFRGSRWPFTENRRGLWIGVRAWRRCSITEPYLPSSRCYHPPVADDDKEKATPRAREGRLTRALAKARAAVSEDRRAPKSGRWLALVPATAAVLLFALMMPRATL